MPRSSQTRTVSLTVGGQPGLDGVSLVRLVRIPGQHQNRFGGSHASTRPVPSQPLAWKRARNSPPSRRSPSTSPSQRARRRGSVSADHRSSISVSKRSSMRTMPVPSADRRLPRIRTTVPCLARHVVLLRSRFPRATSACRASSRPSHRTRYGTSHHRAAPAARGGDRRPAAAPPGERPRVPPPASTRRCRDTPGRAIGSSAASSPAVAGPRDQCLEQGPTALVSECSNDCFHARTVPMSLRNSQGTDTHGRPKGWCGHRPFSRTARGGRGSRARTGGPRPTATAARPRRAPPSRPHRAGGRDP